MFRPWMFNELSTFPRHSVSSPENRQRRGRPERDQLLRFHDFDLRFEPGPARARLARAGLLVQTPLAPLLEFELLHRVRHEDLGAVNPRLLERAIEQFPGGPD